MIYKVLQSPLARRPTRTLNIVSSRSVPSTLPWPFHWNALKAWPPSHLLSRSHRRVNEPLLPLIGDISDKRTRKYPLSSGHRRWPSLTTVVTRDNEHTYKHTHTHTHNSLVASVHVGTNGNLLFSDHTRRRQLAVAAAADQSLSVSIAERRSCRWSTACPLLSVRETGG